MQLKIRIICEICDCGFELSADNFVERENLACPNCGQKLPESVVSHFCTGLREFAQVPDVWKDFSQNSLFGTEKFKFLICEPSNPDIQSDFMKDFEKLGKIFAEDNT